jgi:hypothetical protein
MNALHSDDIMATFYSKDFYQMSDVCIEATKVFSGVLALLRQSGKKSIRVLEVGAGVYPSRFMSLPITHFVWQGLGI